MGKLCLNFLQNILPLYETFVQNIINITHRIAEKKLHCIARGSFIKVKYLGEGDIVCQTPQVAHTFSVNFAKMSWNHWFIETTIVLIL